MINQGEFQSNSDPKNPDLLREYAGLLTDVSDLVDVIEFSRAKTVSENVYTFLRLDDSIRIPEGIEREIGHVDTVILSLGTPVEDEPNYFSIDLFSADQMCTISRSSDSDSAVEDLIIDTSSITPGSPKNISKNNETQEEFDKRLMPIDRVSTKELNTLIMSLVHPDSDRGYDMFESANFLDTEVLEGLSESLKLAALEQSDGQRYEISSGDGTVQYFRHEGQPTSFTVAYVDYKKDLQIIASSNMETSFKLEFRTIDVVPGLNSDFVDGTNKFNPDADDIRYLRSMLANEITKLRSLVPATVDIEEEEYQPNDLVDGAKAFEDSGKDYFSPSYTDGTLQNLDDFEDLDFPGLDLR